MKQPELDDFGVTPEEYEAYKLALHPRASNDRDPSGLVVFLSITIAFSVILSVSFLITGSWGSALGWTLLAFAVFSMIGWGLAAVISHLIQWIFLKFEKPHSLDGSVISRIKQYEEAQAAYNVAQSEALKAQQEANRHQQEAERQRREAERARQAALLAEQRKREQYWKSLGGKEFERELGKLFSARGYDVRYTGRSGDQGGDLILRKDGETTVVQCKAWKNPATPQVARELGGSMMYYKADKGILACTGGFSGGVLEFARVNPITLIDARDIARMAVESGDGMPDVDESPPVCPIDGCGSDMVVRNGRYGSFWGCPRYPACQGRRALAARSLFR